MVSLIATLVFAVLISVLLSFTRDRGIKLSAAVWLTFAWLWFASSRNPTQWLQPHGGSKGPASSAYDEGSAFDRNILTGLMLLGVIVLARRSQRTTAFLAANIPVILFFLYCGVSATWSEHGDVSIRRWFRGLGDLVMVMVILTDLDWERVLKWVYTRLACLLVPLSILFFRYYPNLGRSYSIHDGHVSATGVTDDKNLLGLICMLFALAMVWAMIAAVRAEGRRKSLLIGYGLVIAMAIYLISIAGSATATACLVEGVIVLIFTSRSRTLDRPKRIHLIVAAMLGFSAFNLFGGSSLLGIVGRNATLTGRTDLWALCLTLVRNPLVGAGYESFWLGWRLEKMWTYISGVNQAHNGYLEIYLNLGWVGVALLVTLLITGYRNIIRSIRRREPSGSLRLAYFVAACVYNCTEAGFKMMHPMWIAFLLVTTAAPAWDFARQRLTGYREASGKPRETGEFANVLAGK
jgi:exopolysaccharide production protein ExoQ